MNRQRIARDILRSILLAAGGNRAVGILRLIRRSASCAERDLVVVHRMRLVRTFKTRDAGLRLRILMRFRRISRRHAPEHAAVHRGQASSPSRQSQRHHERQPSL